MIHSMEFSLLPLTWKELDFMLGICGASYHKIYSWQVQNQSTQLQMHDETGKTTT